jgi:tartrate dehydrogenase/decarboxylase/D-malate dehydrogenase
VARHRIAVIPGDGIGKEVIEAGLGALAAVEAASPGLALAFESFPWGSDYYREHGRMMPADALETLAGFDAIYFGAVGDTRIADHITLWGLRLAICQGFDQYANVRPARLAEGIDGPLAHVAPGDLDWIIVRENSEGEYAGAGGRAHRGFAGEVGTETAVFTRAGCERIMRFAFDLARTRRRLTLVTKSNAQRHGMVLWDEVFAEVARDFANVETDRVLVDAMTVRMVTDPTSLDVIVATNLHADILSDLAAALAGGLGLAPSANLNPERRFPSMFEPVHGAAHDIAGKGVANPYGALASAAMMLDHLGETDAAARLETAIRTVLAARRGHTRDLGGEAGTAEACEAVCRAIAGPLDDS